MLVNGFTYFSGIFVVVFHHKIFVFIIFISFFDEISNFPNRVLTDQKNELLVSNCQWNCMKKHSKFNELGKKCSYFIKLFDH